MGPAPAKGESEAQWQARHDKSLLPSERYDLFCLYAFGDVLHAETRIELASALFARSPKAFRLPKELSQRHIWLDCNLAHFVGGIVTLRDTVFILTSAVAGLDLKPEKRSLGSIAKHQHVRQTSLESHLCEFAATIDAHRERRNRIVHRAEIASLSAYVGIERATFAHGISMVEGDLKHGRSGDWARDTWHEMLRTATPKLLADKERVLLATEVFLDQLADISMETMAMMDVGIARCATLGALPK